MGSLEEMIDTLETLRTEANQAQKEYEMLALALMEARGYAKILSVIVEMEESAINARFCWNEAQAAVEVQREHIALKKLLMQREIALRGMN